MLPRNNVAHITKVKTENLLNTGKINAEELALSPATLKRNKDKKRTSFGPPLPIYSPTVNPNPNL